MNFGSSRDTDHLSIERVKVILECKSLICSFFLITELASFHDQNRI